jgi:4-amino-4-deoxy-L-arabinose transferase-like glycosyltransferase
MTVSPDSPDAHATTAPTAIWAGLVVFVVLLAATLNNTVPYHGDETYYTASAIHMVQRGDYDVPVFFGHARFQKPILPYWATALGYFLFGISLWSGRLAFIAMALAMLWVTYRFALRLQADGWYAMTAVVLLASSTLFVEASRIAMTDLPLAFFSLIALYHFNEAQTEPARARRHDLAAFAAMGLATASKGPLGLLPLVAVILAAAVTRQAESLRRLRQRAHPLCWLTWALPGLAWYAYVAVFHQDEFFRQLSVESSANLPEGPGAIMVNVLFYTAAAVLYFPLAAAAGWRAARDHTALPQGFRLITCYAAVTGLLPIVALHGHRPRYLLTAFPAIALLAGWVLARGRWRSVAPRTALVWACLQAVFLIAVPAIRGEPLKPLIRHWDQSLQQSGTLTSYALPTRELSWAQALSHGRIRPYDEESPYVILRESDLGVFPHHTVIRRAQILDALRFEDHRLVAVRRAFVLIDRRREH